MKQKVAAFAVLAAICAAAYASEASWYKWKSRLDGSVVCMQVSPGSYWFVYRGPYQDAQCRKPGNPQ